MTIYLNLNIYPYIDIDARIKINIYITPGKVVGFSS